ncbi:MAG: SMR family transporter [bacterium]
MPQVFLLLLISIFITASAHLCFKKAMIAFGSLDFSLHNILFLIPRIVQNAWLILGIFLFGASFILWLFILSKLQLNIAYPIAISCEVTLVTIGAWFLFKEYISPIQILGIVVIIIGIFLLVKS